MKQWAAVIVVCLSLIVTQAWFSLSVVDLCLDRTT